MNKTFVYCSSLPVTVISSLNVYLVPMLFLTISHSIGVNISERKSGTERKKKRKKRELVCFPTDRGRNGVHRL